MEEVASGLLRGRQIGGRKMGIAAGRGAVGRACGWRNGRFESRELAQMEEGNPAKGMLQWARQDSGGAVGEVIVALGAVALGNIPIEDL